MIACSIEDDLINCFRWLYDWFYLHRLTSKQNIALIILVIIFNGVKSYYSVYLKKSLKEETDFYFQNPAFSCQSVYCNLFLVLSLQFWWKINHHHSILEMSTWDESKKAINNCKSVKGGLEKGSNRWSLMYIRICADQI